MCQRGSCLHLAEARGAVHLALELLFDLLALILELVHKVLCERGNVTSGWCCPLPRNQFDTTGTVCGGGEAACPGEIRLTETEAGLVAGLEITHGLLQALHQVFKLPGSRWALAVSDSNLKRLSKHLSSVSSTRNLGTWTRFSGKGSMPRQLQAVVWRCRAIDISSKAGVPRQVGILPSGRKKQEDETLRRGELRPRTALPGPPCSS